LLGERGHQKNNRKGKERENNPLSLNWGGPANFGHSKGNHPKIILDYGVEGGSEPLKHGWIAGEKKSGLRFSYRWHLLTEKKKIDPQMRESYSKGGGCRRCKGGKKKGNLPLHETICQGLGVGW